MNDLINNAQLFLFFIHNIDEFLVRGKTVSELGSMN